MGNKEFTSRSQLWQDSRLNRPIGLADLIIAMAALKPETEKEKQEIASLLGFAPLAGKVKLKSPTGSLKESKPALQNIPIKTALGAEIRKKFTGK
jgi:hypothetical protein